MSGDGVDGSMVKDSGGLIFPSPWVGVAALFSAAHAILVGYVFTLQPGLAPVPLRGSAILLTVFAAAAVAYDAWQSGAPGSWSPSPVLWGAGLLLPAFSLGILVAYTVRRLQTENPRLERLWVQFAVGSNLVSGVLITSLVATGATGSEALPFSPVRSLLLIAAAVFIGLATPAAYYDTRLVQARFGGTGETWLLRGYHWVALLSIPHPVRALVALVYLVRRRTLLKNLPVAPADPTGVVDDDNT